MTPEQEQRLADFEEARGLTYKDGKRYCDVIPFSTLDTLESYVVSYLPTGHFLQAVLSNSLLGAIGRADEENLKALHAIVLFVANRIPLGCWGSVEKVDAWLEKWDEDRCPECGCNTMTDDPDEDRCAECVVTAGEDMGEDR